MVTPVKRLESRKTGGESPTLHSLRALVRMLLGTVLVMMPVVARAEIVLTDATGTEVRLAAPAHRIVFNDSLLLLSLALIDDDPLGKIAGWAGPRRIDQGVYAAFRARYPQIDAIPDVGSVVPANISPEGILAIQPDLFVISLWQPGWETLTDILKHTGVPVLFLDGPANEGRNPAEATIFSIELLGAAIGKKERAKEYADFVRDRYQTVTERLKGADERPTVLVDAFAGAECCSTPGRDNRLTQNVELAGGKVVGVERIMGYEGRLNPEAVIGLDPDIYIGTGVPRPPVEAGLVLGGGLSRGTARASLETILSQGIRRELRAVREKRSFAVAHQMAISALSVLTFECFAKWIHPDLFPDVDPDATLALINRRFFAVPLEGTFCIGLADGDVTP